MLEDKAEFNHEKKGLESFGVTPGEYTQMHLDLIKFGMRLSKEIGSFTNAVLVERLMEYYEIPKTKFLVIAVSKTVENFMQINMQAMAELMKSEIQDKENG